MNKLTKSIGYGVLVLAFVALSTSFVMAAGLTATITSPIANTSVNVGQTVNLSATSANAVGAVNYVWSFSDGTASRTGENQTVSFTTAGLKTITLMAGDASGANDVKTVNINVNAVVAQKPIITNIAYKDVTQTSVTITWTTDILATSRVIYDTTSHPDISDQVAPNFGYAASTGETDTETKVTSHSVTITTLSPGTKYYFRVLSRG